MDLGGLEHSTVQDGKWEWVSQSRKSLLLRSREDIPQCKVQHGGQSKHETPLGKPVFIMTQLNKILDRKEGVGKSSLERVQNGCVVCACGTVCYWAAFVVLENNFSRPGLILSVMKYCGLAQLCSLICLGAP